MLSRRKFLKLAGTAAAVAAVPVGIQAVTGNTGGSKEGKNVAQDNPVAGTNGEHYIPFNERKGA